MADKEETGTETKEKRTVPGLERSPRGIIEHSEKVWAMVFDREKGQLKDVMLGLSALFGYVRTLATLLIDTEARLEGKRVSDNASHDTRMTALEKRIEAFETQFATAEQQGVAMMKAMMDGTSPLDVIKQLGDTKEEPRTVPGPGNVVAVMDTQVTPLKPDKSKKRTEENHNNDSKGGAA